jgi:hypothetical protein
MQETDLYTQVVEYFDAFSSKDLDRLEALYSSNIYLRDWDGTWVGSHAVLRANKEIFDSISAIVIRPIALHFDIDARTCAAEIEILAEGMETLIVVDVIEFGSTAKITSIRAYKG